MRNDFDVIVAGAGPSGIAAALSAARNGAQVLLFDRGGCPGGMNTLGMVCPLMAFHAGERQIVKGIAQELVNKLEGMGATLGHIPDPIGMVSSITPIDTESLKLLYFEMLSQEKNITLLLYTMLESADYEHGRVKSVTTLGKNGKTTYTADAYIDATGDGDLAALCKAEYVLGRSADGISQPMTLMFSVGGVRLDETRAYVRENPEQFILNKNCDLNQYLAVSGFFSLVKEAQGNGDFSIPRDRVLFFQGLHPGEVTINMIRVSGLSSIDDREMITAEIEAHRQVRECVSFLQKYIPGFSDCFLSAVAHQTGVRESRHIKGKFVLSGKHVLHNQTHPESIAMCAFPIDIHAPIGNELNWIRKEKICCYDIPYGVMIPVKFHNLLVTGRCISATHEALASARITVTAMALGEAAGVAAALAVQKEEEVCSIDIPAVQQRLFEQGAIPGKQWL